MTTELLKRISELERRVLSLEGKLFHAGHLSRAVRVAIDAQEDEFTSAQIRDVVYTRQPELRPIEEQGQVSVVISRMERAGQVVCTEKGAGPNPNRYCRTARPVDARGGGAVRGHKRDYESGFRSVVRTALASGDLPAAFTVRDVRAWCAEHAPEVRVPYGSWSSTLFKLQQAGELVELPERVPSRQFGSLKAYRLGMVRVAPSGAVRTDKEQAWAELRGSMKTDVPELLAFTNRVEEEEEDQPAPPPIEKKRRVYGTAVQLVRAMPFGREFTARDFNGAGGPGMANLLRRLFVGGELEEVLPAIPGSHGRPAVYKRKVPA